MVPPNVKASVPEALPMRKALDLFCFCWVLMHIYAAIWLPFSLDELKILHLGLAMVIIFFPVLPGARHQMNREDMIYLVLCLIALVLTFYFFFDYGNMIERSGFPSHADIAAGTILITLVLWATKKSWGMVIPIIILLAMLYALFGQYLGGFFYHSGMDYGRFVGYCSTYFMGTLGSLTDLSASVIIHFLLFGALLQACGGTELIEKISIIVGSRYRSGPAQTAILSSGFMGMISGSTAANVAVTGAFTIPLMKRRGFNPNFAGAVEAVASTGGQIMPPVMGVAAFIMAGLTNKPYGQIVVAAFLPAAVYFISLSFAVLIRSRKEDIKLIKMDAEQEKIGFKDVLRDHGHLLLPLVILTWRVIIGETPAKAVLYANAALVLVGLAHNLIMGRKQPWATAKAFCRQLYFGVVRGGMEAAKLGVVIGGMGIIVEMFTVTGFGQRLSYSIVDLAGGNSLVLIILVGILTIFFGMGMPTPGAYLLTVLLSAPALIKFGFPELPVHFYVFYFAIISAVTPPVAIAVLVAIGISGGRYSQTALHSMRLALPGFLMPLYFLYKPVILGLQHDPYEALLFNAVLLVGLLGVNIFFEGHFLRKVGWLGRLICLGAAAMIFHPSWMLSWLGLAALAGFVLAHIFFLKDQEAGRSFKLS